MANNSHTPNKNLLRKVPGFRSGNKINSIIASVAYFFLSIFILVGIIPTAPTLAINEIPATSLSTVEIKGETGKDKQVILYQNGEKILETKSSSGGNFTLTLKDLEEGSFTYLIEVCKTNEKKYCKSDEITVLIDKTPPQEPKINEITTQVEEEKVDFTGKAEPYSQINFSLNDKSFTSLVDGSGNFSYQVPLEIGMNNIVVFSVDEAKNKSKEQVLEIERIKNVFLVTRVIDGDTIEIETGERIRYIGIDTSEPGSSDLSVQCFAKKATEKNKELVENKEVRLEKDVSETDKYGRLLRYVYIGDIFVNDHLVRQGYANPATYPPDVKYQQQFLEAEREAKEKNRGLWSECQFTPTPTIQTKTNSTSSYTPQPTKSSGSAGSTWTPAPTPVPTKVSTGIYSCDCSKTCSQISSCEEAYFQLNSCGCSVRDGDNDGVPCESLCR